MARLRKNVWKLTSNDQTLVWYERAITVMKQRPFTDPTSWRYQAAIHDYNRAGDPLARPSDTLPSKAEQTKYWSQCQHGSWYFLPWHRMYLHHFETIVGAAVETLGGPSDWGLPYWNYSDASDPHARLLPTAFRKPKKSGGSVNALYVATRTPACNGGKPFADDADVAIATPLREPAFKSVQFGTGFGGPDTPFVHAGSIIGSLELAPHGTIHVAVGGWMQFFYSAALDPIFWLHHANIDRLWQVWLDRDPSHTNPTTKWPSAVSFDFRDAAGQAVKMTPGQVVDTTAAPLGYSYDDTGDPLALAPTIVQAPKVAPMTKTTQPEMMGATTAPFMLDQMVTQANFAVKTMPAVKARSATKAATVTPPAVRRVFLNIEKVVSKESAPSYDVYLNVPEGQDPKDHPSLLVGRLPMFGLVESSTKRAARAGAGLHYALDITPLYAHVSTLPGWDPTHLRVMFVPARGQSPAKVSVGRVSLYVEWAS